MTGFNFSLAVAHMSVFVLVPVLMEKTNYKNKINKYSVKILD